jgi:tRNA A37 threonylcarbamoyladenosine biosynthesis protein TsaE
MAARGLAARLGRPGAWRSPSRPAWGDAAAWQRRRAIGAAGCARATAAAAAAGATRPAGRGACGGGAAAAARDGGGPPAAAAGAAGALIVARESGMRRLAAALAADLRPGDAFLLYGAVGAGKSTFRCARRQRRGGGRGRQAFPGMQLAPAASQPSPSQTPAALSTPAPPEPPLALPRSRAFIRAAADDPGLTVPSPTFLLQQIYDDHEGARRAGQGQGRAHAAAPRGRLRASPDSRHRRPLLAWPGCPSLCCRRPRRRHITPSPKGPPIHHFDLYRLEAPGSDLGRLDMGASFSAAVSLVEWPERLPAALVPRERLELAIEIMSEVGGRGAVAGAGAAVLPPPRL